MQDTKYGLVQFYRSHLGNTLKSTTKHHIHNTSLYAKKITLCRWDFSRGHGVSVAQYTSADIDEQWMLRPEEICKTCYGEFLKNTGRFIAYEMETQTPEQCGCKVMIREHKEKKVAWIYFCDRHKDA